MRLILLATALLSFSLLTHANPDLFANGIKQYQAQDFTKAAESFSTLLQQDPQNPDLLTNLALAKFGAGQRGLAIAYLRMALDLSPGHDAANGAMLYVLQEGPVQELSKRSELSEWLYINVFRSASLDWLLTINAALLFAFGWLFITHVSQHRLSIKNESAPPRLRASFIIILALLVFSTTLSLGKLWSLSISRGTVISSKTTILSGPFANQAELFEVFEGIELIILSQANDWYQVRYPGGQSGWIEAKHLLITTRRKP